MIILYLGKSVSEFSKSSPFFKLNYIFLMLLFKKDLYTLKIYYSSRYNCNFIKAIAWKTETIWVLWLEFAGSMFVSVLFAFLTSSYEGIVKIELKILNWTSTKFHGWVMYFDGVDDDWLIDWKTLCYNNWFLARLLLKNLLTLINCWRYCSKKLFRDFFFPFPYREVSISIVPGACLALPAFKVSGHIKYRIVVWCLCVSMMSYLQCCCVCRKSFKKPA